METHSNDRHERHGHAGNAPRWVFWGFALVAGYFLVTEHRAHLLGILPYLLVLACPLMHLFHHHGRRHGDGRAGAFPAETGDTNASSGAPSHPDQ